MTRIFRTACLAACGLSLGISIAHAQTLPRAAHYPAAKTTGHIQVFATFSGPTPIEVAVSPSQSSNDSRCSSGFRVSPRSVTRPERTV